MADRLTSVTVERIDDTFHFRAFNDTGGTVDMDSIPDRDGPPRGVGPMQLLLVALGGCSGIDVVMILNKGRQTIDTMSISIDGVRPGDTGPSPYQRIHARYELTGDLDPDKVVRAVRLSIDKYCSVAKTLALKSEITYTCIVNGNEHG